MAPEEEKQSCDDKSPNEWADSPLQRTSPEVPAECSLEDLGRYIFRLGLTGRLRNTMLRALGFASFQPEGIPARRVACLWAMSDDDLLGIKGIGRKGVKDIRDKIREAADRGLPISEEEVPATLNPHDLEQERGSEYRKRWHERKKRTDPEYMQRCREYSRDYRRRRNDDD